MTTAVKSQLVSTDNLPVELGVADAVIEGLRLRLKDLKADTPNGYKMIRLGIAETRSLRGQVEKSRKELKDFPLTWGKNIDQEAKRLTGMIFEIESPLKEMRDEVDDEKARVKRDKDEKARLAQEALEREERLKQKRIEDAERKRIQEEQEKERKKLEADRVEIERQRAKQEDETRVAREALALQKQETEKAHAKLQEELDKFDERKRLAEEAEQAELKEQQDRLKVIQGEKLAKEREIEGERIAKKRAAENAILAAERKPDAEKIREFAEALRGIEYPTMKTEWGQETIDTCKKRIGEQAGDLDTECRMLQGQES